MNRLRSMVYRTHYFTGGSTIIHVSLQVYTGTVESRRTVANKSIRLIHACSTMLTRIRNALVDVCLTRRTCKVDRKIDILRWCLRVDKIIFKLNSQISIAPYGHNFRGVMHISRIRHRRPFRSDECHAGSSRISPRPENFYWLRWCSPNWSLSALREIVWWYTSSSTRDQMAVKTFAKVDQSVIPNVNCTWRTTCDIFSVFATHRLDLQSKKLLLSKQYTFTYHWQNTLSRFCAIS